MSQNEPKLGDTLPARCPKCDWEDWKFVGYNHISGYLVWRCAHCQYDHSESPLDARRHPMYGKIRNVAAFGGQS